VEEVALEEVFCSQLCRSQRSDTRTAPLQTNEATLLEGYDAPIRTGWRLWFRSIPSLTLRLAPVGLLASLILFQIEVVSENLFGPLLLLLLLTGAFGIALIQAGMAREYTGMVTGNLYLWTLKRFAPWLLTEVIVLGAATLGTLAFVVPGIIVGLRWFWADEFALVHGMGPIRSTKESWELTRGESGAIFLFQTLAGLAAYGVFFIGVVVFVVLATGFEAVGVPETTPLQGALVIILAYLGYAGVHAPEVAYFYGMRAARSRPLDAAGPLSIKARQ
jgi:hypothetical protein